MPIMRDAGDTATRRQAAAAQIKHGSDYPAPFDMPCRGRSWQALGDVDGLTQYGVNRLRLPPGTWSSQRHWHEREDEFVYVLAGEVVLVMDRGERVLSEGDSVGFRAGTRDGHHFQNRSASEVTLLIVGSRDPRDRGEYSDIDMIFYNDDAGDTQYLHKDGASY